MTTPRRTSTLEGTTAFMFTMAVLVGLGTAIAGIAVAAHTVPICEPNPFDSSLTSCDGSTHPLVGVGLGTLFGGLVMVAVLAGLGLIARAVGQMQAASDLATAAAARVAADAAAADAVPVDSSA